MKLSSLINSRRLNEDQIAAAEELIDRGFNTVVDAAIGVGEVGLSMISGAVAEPASGLYGLGSLVFQDLDSATGDIESIQNRMTYEPRTEAGKKGIGYLGSTIGKIGEAVDNFSGYLGDKVLDATDSPELAAAAATLPAAAFEILPTGKAPKVKSLGIKGYHGGSYKGGEIDPRQSDRGGLGPYLYSTTDKEVASNYGKSGYFDDDSVGGDRGYLTEFDFDESKLLNLESLSINELIDAVGIETITDSIKRDSPDLFQEFEMRAEMSGADFDDWLVGDDGIDAISDYIEDIDPDTSFEGPSLERTSVGKFVSANDGLGDQILDYFGKHGYIYTDSQTGGKTITVSNSKPIINSKTESIE